jgi:hypothetical protein
MKIPKRYKPATLILPIAGSILVSGAASQLPPKPISDGLRLLAGTASLVATGKSWCDAVELESHEAQNEADDAVRAAAIEADARCNASYYRRYPNHFRANKPVPEEWRAAWAASGGNPALMMAAPNLTRALQASTLVQPIAQPQPQSIQEPGQTRGGSFDRAAASESPGTGWGDYEPRPTQPIAQTPIAHQSFSLQSEPDDAWLDRLIAPSVLLVFGGDGSGKTSMALELLRRRQNAGHQVIALDPHASPDKWPGCDVVGAGLNFPKIERAIDSLMSLIKQRYEQIGSGEIAPCGFPPITFVCEELTDWKASVSNAALLILKAGDYRKVNIHLLMVSHGDSLGQIGAPDGSSEVVKNCFTKLRLYSQPGSDGRPIPAMKGEMAYPLQAPIAVSVPRFGQRQPETPQPNPETATAQTISPDIADRFGFHETPETPPKRPEMMALPPAETRNDNEPPKGAECRDLFFRLKDLGLNQTQIIKAIWGATPGDSPQYRMARDFYQLLNSEYSQISGESAA